MGVRTEWRRFYIKHVYFYGIGAEIKFVANKKFYVTDKQYNFYLFNRDGKTKGLIKLTVCLGYVSVCGIVAPMLWI